jgi:defect-in-organelle-trafficking protein DotC
MGLKKVSIFGLLGVSMLAGCTAMPVAPVAVKNLPEEMAPAPTSIGKKDDHRMGPAPLSAAEAVKIEIYNPDDEEQEITELRKRALMEAAQGYGSQMGYARRGWEIGKTLEKRSTELSGVYDFNRVVSEAPVKAGYILPPIVSRSHDAFRTDAEGREASVADEYLTIVEPGKIRPVMPTWRDYLMFAPKTPEEPAKTLFPSNKLEKEMFEGWFTEGWDAGKELADAELQSRLDRLNRDYAGMLQYRRLVSMGMMDRMVLQDADFGVTGGGDEMRIGSRTVRIVGDAEFQKDPSRWKTRSVTERDKEIVKNGQITPMAKSDY